MNNLILTICVTGLCIYSLSISLMVTFFKKTIHEQFNFNCFLIKRYNLDLEKEIKCYVKVKKNE